MTAFSPLPVCSTLGAMNSIMQVRDLVKHYGTVRAVDGVSFEIPEGICFGLLGPNGAGKTTTIEMMEGILKGTSGEILFRGEPIGQRFREKVGIQFQSTALPEYITVRETLKMFHAFYPDPRAIEDVIHICSLDDIINRDNRKLSGGQRQRIGIARAIYHNPAVLILDEATSALDSLTERAIMDAIDNLSHKKTIIMIAHRLTTVKKCDQIYIMDRGVISQKGTYDELIASNESFRRMAEGS